jgi:hypothetical protein
MAQHDYNIANQTASSARTDINNAFAAIQSTNSGVAAPTTTVGNMIWYDTTNNILQIRNEGNTAWITLGTVNQSNSKFEPNQTIATQAEAEAGTNNTKLMTAIRVKQSVVANVTIPDSIGVNQSWSAPARSGNTWYQNTTGRAIMVNMKGTSTTDSYLRVGASTGSYVTIDNRDGDSGTWDHADAIVPNNHYYYFQGSGGVQAYILS